MSNGDILVSVKEASKMLFVSEQVIRKKLRDGELRGKKIFGQWKVFKSDIDNIMNS